MADQHEVVASSGLSADEESQMEGCSSQTYEYESSTSLSDAAPSTRQKGKVKNEKICKVCGDKALGYNFNAITCESCKAFFRRNAFKDKSMKCLFENNCVVDIRTRRFCPACRIRKCFAVGMNRDMILDDRERKKRQAKKYTTGLKTEPISAEASPLLETVKSELDSLDTSGTSSMAFPDIEMPSSPYGKMHGEKSNVSFKHPPPDALPTETNMYPELNEKQAKILSSITDAYRCTMISDPLHEGGHRYENTADLINHSELVVRKLIMFVKYLEDFKVMSQEDQIACLKACVMNSILLRSALYYSVEKDAWLTDKEQYIPTSILKSATGFVSIHDSHITYCRKVKTMAEDDLNIYSIMQVLIIFDPASQNVSNREFISSIQDRFFLILKRYLESRFSYKFAKEYFATVIDCLCEVKLLSENHSQILLQVNPLDVEPLMLEVLNLK